MQVLPGVLAVGEQARSSGRDMLTALLLGYDVAARLAGGIHAAAAGASERSGVAVGRGRGGRAPARPRCGGISRAMRIATTLVLTPSYTNAVAGATALNVAGGMSGFAAALAPDLALAGFEAQDDAIEQALGQLVGGGFTPDGLLDELGTTWHITRNYFRLYACCNPIHPALDCLQAGAGRIAPAARRDRAHRHRDLSVCLGDAQSGSAELISPRNTRCRTPPRRWWCADMPATPHSTIRAVHDPAIAALRHRVHGDGGSGDDRAWRRACGRRA